MGSESKPAVASALPMMMNKRLFWGTFVCNRMWMQKKKRDVYPDVSRKNRKKKSLWCLVWAHTHTHRTKTGMEKGLNLIILSYDNGYKEPLICFISPALLCEWKWNFCPSAACHPLLFLSPRGCDGLPITSLISLPFCGRLVTSVHRLSWSPLCPLGGSFLVLNPTCSFLLIQASLSAGHIWMVTYGG